MATIDCTVDPAVHQPLFSVLAIPDNHGISSPSPTGQSSSLAAYMDDCLTVINIAERLPILSQDLMDAVADGRPMYQLRQRLAVLHNNLAELAALAIRVKTVPLPPRMT